MTFQLFRGRRGPPPVALPAGHLRPKLRLRNGATGARESPVLDHDSVSMPVDLAPALTSVCAVERACAAFHAAQNCVAAIAEGHDETALPNLEIYLQRRDETLEQVRMHVARTRRVWQAKFRVLIVMRDWSAGENPDLSAFALEIAFEAAALLDGDLAQTDRCQQEQGEPISHQLRASERRSPLSWLARPWGNGTDAPFAN